MPVSHTLLMYLDVILVFLQVNTLRGVQKVKFLLTRESDHCSCPLISRQGVYLKLTLPADVDILAESDNPTHCADGFHCNVRSPLQDYAMPFLHSVSAWTRCSLPSSFSRTFLPFHYSEDCLLPMRSTIKRVNQFLHLKEKRLLYCLISPLFSYFLCRS